MDLESFVAKSKSFGIKAISFSVANTDTAAGSVTT
tara:strand:- start:607 stop:711 length:105 start_codon:yes stop_codon:yes gene_type:complete